MSTLKRLGITYGSALALILIWIGVTRAAGWLDYPMWLALLVGLISVVAGHVIYACFAARGRS